MAQIMIKRRELSEALGSLKSAVGTNVKARSQGVHREMIAAVESALKAMVDEYAARDQRLSQQLKTTKLDAMKLAYEPDILLIAHGRTYPALLCKLGPAVAEAVSFHDSSPPTLSLDEYSHAAVDTAIRMLHFTGSMPEGVTPQQLFETLQLATHWELPIVARLHDLIGQELESPIPAYDTALNLLSYMQDKLGAKCSECCVKCGCRKDASQLAPPACTCVLCDKCPGTAFLKLRKKCFAMLARDASALSDEIVRALPIVDMLPAVDGVSESVPELEVLPAQAEELNLVHAKIVATIAARKKLDDSDSDSDFPGLRFRRDEKSNGQVAARTVEGGKSAAAGFFVQVKSTTSTDSPPAVVKMNEEAESKWAAPFCTPQVTGRSWAGQDGRLWVAKKLEAGETVVFKASVRIESLWMRYKLIMRFLQARGVIDDATSASPVQGLVRASAHAALGEPLLQAMRTIFLEVIARNFDLCDDLSELDGVSMAQLLTSEQLTVSDEAKVMRMFVAWAAVPSRPMHEISGVAPAVRFPLCKLWPLMEPLQGLMAASDTVRELVNEALKHQMERTVYGPSARLQPSKRKFLLDSNSELSEIPRTKARKKASRGSVQRLTAEQLTCHALGMADPTPTPIVAHSSTGRPLPLLSDSDDSD